MGGVMVSVAVVATRTEAELIVGLLCSHGVSAAVSADDAGGQYPQLQAEGVRVLVAPADEASARRLLGAADDAPLDEPVDQIEAQGRTRVPTRGAQVGDSGPEAPPRSWDWAVPPSNHRYLHERLPRSELDLVDVGHFTWEDATDQDAEIVTQPVEGKRGASMRAITYTRLGDPSVLKLVEKPIPEPDDGEVRIRVLVSGVNPTDWKSRSGAFGGGLAEATVPNHDGAGVVDEVGAGVSGFRVGDRVWVTLAGDGRPAGGTAQEFTVVPAERAFALPAGADLELGASIGIPAVTAHRALTVAEDGPARLAPDALAGRAVMVAGGAGAVGNAALQLARWAGAEVIATVSGEAKARLATAAGAHHVVNYKEADAAAAIRGVAPDGVDLVVEVAAGANAELDLAVLRPRGTISVYANDGGAPLNLDVRRNMGLNARYQFVLLYTVGWDRIMAAAADVNQAIEDGAFRVGEQAGLPLHRYRLEDAAAAHAAVERGAVGKVLITVAES